MIRLRLQQFIKKALKPFASEPAKIPTGHDTIYLQLAMQLAHVSTIGVRLTPGVSTLGVFSCYFENMDQFLKSLLEVNSILEAKETVPNNLFHVKKKQQINLDRFLFVEDGYYIRNPEEKLQKVLTQISVYLDHMKDADTFKYGPMEHNHRQLYFYTMMINSFLELLLEHFKQ